MASFSYTMYLTHLPILGLFAHFSTTAPLRVVDIQAVGGMFGKIAVCGTVGFALYWLVEKRTPLFKYFYDRLLKFVEPAPRLNATESKNPSLVQRPIDLHSKDDAA